MPPGGGSVVLIIATILLTYVRTAIITIGLATIMFPVLNRGKNTFQIILVLCVVAFGGNYILNKTPSSDKVGARLQTIGSITEDGSFKGRIQIAAYGIGALIKNPIGTGLGSTGMGGRVNTGEITGSGVIGDNGYFEILLPFGLIGGSCFFYALYLVWKQVRIFEKHGIRTETLMVAKTLFVTGAVALFAGNWFAGPGSVVFCVFAGFSVYPKPAMDRVAKALAEKRLSGKPAAGISGGRLLGQNDPDRCGKGAYHQGPAPFSISDQYDGKIPRHRPEDAQDQDAQLRYHSGVPAMSRLPLPGVIFLVYGEFYPATGCLPPVCALIS